MGAITDKGFVRPTYAQLLAAQEARAKQYFGDDIDVGEFSVLGKFIRITVYDLAALYEELEGVYFARFPNYAAGVSLDRLMPFAGISRNPAVAAVFNMRFAGDAGAVVPAGFRVATADGVVFRTERSVALGADGAAVEPVVCTQCGPAGNVAPGSINIIVNPTAQVSGITQLEQAVNGRERESDAELRERFRVAVLGVGSATQDAIRAAVLRVAGVTGCTVVENDTGETDAGGVPPHSFQVFVLGETASDVEIAGAIYSKKPIGVNSWGDVEVAVRDAGGGEHMIRFARVAEVALHVRMTARVTSLFPADGAAQLAKALAAYINAFPAGKDLVFSSLYQVIYGVPGMAEAAGLAVSTDGGATWAQSSVAVAPAAAVRLQQGDVAVEVEPYADN